MPGRRLPRRMLTSISSNRSRGSTDQQGLLTNLTQQVSDLQRENDDLNRKYAEAMNRPIGMAASRLPSTMRSPSLLSRIRIWSISTVRVAS